MCLVVEVCLVVGVCFVVEVSCAVRGEVTQVLDLEAPLDSVFVVKSRDFVRCDVFRVVEIVCFPLVPCPKVI